MLFPDAYFFTTQTLTPLSSLAYAIFHRDSEYQ
jgi:hypothetical protein